MSSWNKASWDEVAFGKAFDKGIKNGVVDLMTEDESDVKDCSSNAEKSSLKRKGDTSCSSAAKVVKTTHDSSCVTSIPANLATSGVTSSPPLVSVEVSSLSTFQTTDTPSSSSIVAPSNVLKPSVPASSASASKSTPLRFVFKQPKPTAENMAKAFEDKHLIKCKFWGSNGGGATINAAAARTNCGKTLMDMDASLYAPGCAAQINLLAAQAHYGMALLEKDASIYVGVARTSLLAAQADYGKSLMQKDPLKYDGISRTNLMLAQANFGKIGLDRLVNQKIHKHVSFRAEISAFVDENHNILIGFIGKVGESTFLTLPDAFNFIWAHEYKKDNVSHSTIILRQLRLAVTWTDKRDVGREPFILCYGFNIYTRRIRVDGTEPRPRLFPSDVLCYKCGKTYSTLDKLHVHHKGNMHTASGRAVPHLECEKFWNAYSN